MAFWSPRLQEAYACPLHPQNSPEDTEKGQERKAEREEEMDRQGGKERSGGEKCTK